MNLECWERDGEGNLLPQEAEIVFDKKELLAEINIIKKREDLDPDVAKKTIKILKDAYEVSKKTEKILFTPLLHFEISSIVRGDNFGCDGKYIEDQRADVCAKHCLDPKKTYEQWRDLKDSTPKRKISTFIMMNSQKKAETSEAPEVDEAFRKAREMITNQSS